MNIYLCRPLVKHVPKMENGIISQCPICGQECWERPELEINAKKTYDQVISLCTECAIKQGGDNQNEKLSRE